MPQMIEVVTTAEHQYQGRRRYPGDKYPCEPAFVGPFRDLGWVRPAETESRALSAEPSQSHGSKRGYNRRDMRAE